MAVATTAVVILAAATVAAAGIGYAGASKATAAQKRANESNIEYQERTNAENIAAQKEADAINLARAKEEQARLEAEKVAAAKKEEERLAPWYEAQKSALERYTQMAENPEISDLTRIRLEEEETAINKELASKGLLFSGPAAELRQKARERIIAEETESAKTMLQNVMGAQAPTSGIYPGTAQYDALIASLNPKVTGTTSIAPRTAANTAAGQGIIGVGAAALGGAQSYLTYQGSKDIADALKQRTTGLYNYPTSLYGSEGYGVGGEMGVGLY